MQPTLPFREKEKGVQAGGEFGREWCARPMRAIQISAAGARTAASGLGCSLIGMLMSSTSETDALAGVTVLFEVGTWSPHHGCQGWNAATCETPFFRKRIMGNSLLAVVLTRRPSQGSVSADAELVGWIGIRPGRPLWSTRTQCHQSICIEG